jgi:hypothetical protein
MHIINRACSQIPNTGATVFACNSTSDLQMHLFCISLHQRKVQTPGGVRLFSCRFLLQRLPLLTTTSMDLSERFKTNTYMQVVAKDDITIDVMALPFQIVRPLTYGIVSIS